MTSPWFTRLAVPGQLDTQTAGLSEERMVELAEQVRMFVTDASAPDLPATVDGRSAFDEAAVSHLIDVRDVVILSRWVTLLAAGLLIICILWGASSGQRIAVGRGLRWGGAGLLIAISLVLLVGFLDFDGFFTTFHGVFFDAGTWQFPADALIIQIFPIGFWMLAAMITGVVTVILSTGLILAGRLSLDRP